MSRNVRRKFPTAPVKAKKRRVSDSSSAWDLSDDDGGYSGLDDVSDSEDDDEEDVNAVEENNIRVESKSSPAAPRPLSDSDGDGDADADADDDDNDLNEDNDDDDEDSLVVDGEADADENASWHGILDSESQVSDFYQDAAIATERGSKRHVRFDVPSSDSDSTDTEDDHTEMFPDLFVAQASLDPAFRRELESDPDDSSGSGSFWDFFGQQGDPADSEIEEVIRQLSEEDDTPVATPFGALLSTAVSSPADTAGEAQELDGYETDGDTTEEDIPEPPVRRKSRRPSVPMSEVSDSDIDTVKFQRGQPRIGRFNLDQSDKKPIAVLNPLTRKMMIFTPHQRRQLDLSPEQFRPEQFQMPAWPMDEQSSPMLSNSANMMISAMFSSNTFGDFVNGQAIGPAEAFFPEANGTADESSTSVDGDVFCDEDEAERSLNIGDFIAWDNHDHTSGDEGDAVAWDLSSTPARPTTATSEADVLSHLKPEIVGAFRRNQINQQLILSNQATQDSLAFSGPYNHTAIKGLRSDRFDTAGVPLTPVRRHRKQPSDFTRSPLESVSSKRKASSEASNAGHKKQRSISDVNMLRI